jgi:aspartate-semialdehyde dehydrogenase
MSSQRVQSVSTVATKNQFNRIAIVGAATLKGREIKDTLEERHFPSLDVRLLDDEESLGQLDNVGEEATFIQSVRPEHFQNVDVAFFASDAAFTRSHWQMARDKGSALVDVSYGVEDLPGAELRAPWVEAELGRTPPASLASEAPLVVVAHPAAIVLGLLLTRAVNSAGVRTAVATILEPASEQGRRGMDELHQQTVNLLSFQQLPKEVFDSQVAFNVLPRYGDQSGPNLQSIERRIANHLREITRKAGVSRRQPIRHAYPTSAPGTMITEGGVAGADGSPLPALTLLQAPIFHSHAFAVYLELGRETSDGELAQVFAGDHVSVVAANEEAPSSVSAAGQNEILISLKRDLLREGGVWLFAVADNLKITALNAVACAESAVAMRPKGPVQ